MLRNKISLGGWLSMALHGGVGLLLLTNISPSTRPKQRQYEHLNVQIVQPLRISDKVNLPSSQLSDKSAVMAHSQSAKSEQKQLNHAPSSLAKATTSSSAAARVVSTNNGTSDAKTVSKPVQKSAKTAPKTPKKVQKTTTKSTASSAKRSSSTAKVTKSATISSVLKSLKTGDGQINKSHKAGGAATTKTATAKTANTSSEAGKNANTSNQYDEAQSLSVTELALILSQIREAWNVSSFSGASVSDMTVTINVRLARSGEVLKATPKLDQTRLNDRVYMAFVQSALQAIHNASPIQHLDSSKYDIWQEMEMEFDPSKML